ncbi:MAG: FAD-dependent oxidoreductase, partial [Kordiimonadaceae bacterium]|nr:FAD-dependent oxidoreductase [Kordiimonadaceae bacterium]
FQGEDGRIIFTIPYLNDFTLIGTTGLDYEGDLSKVTISEEEIDYLCQMASDYLSEPVNKSQIVESFAGVRPLYNDGATLAKEATRDYVLKLDDLGAPLLNIIGGKITTYRVLAEKVMEELEPFLPQMKAPWTETAPLPGGNFKVSEYGLYEDKLKSEHLFLDSELCERLMGSYGLDAWKMLKNVKSVTDMGQHFGAGLYEVEVLYLIKNEWVSSIDDILKRRTKLYLRLNKDQRGALIHWLSSLTIN